jgi:hypothetical protein
MLQVSPLKKIEKNNSSCLQFSPLERNLFGKKSLTKTVAPVYHAVPRRFRSSLF